MGDRTWTGITFSGKLNREVAEGLVVELEGQHCQSESGREITIDDLLNHNQLWDDECNYASMEGVEGYCREHGVSYLKVWAAGGDYEAGYEIYNAVVNQTFQVTGGDDPSLGASELREFMKQGKTLQDVVAYIEQFQQTVWEANYPAVEIVE